MHILARQQSTYKKNLAQQTLLHCLPTNGKALKEGSKLNQHSPSCDLEWMELIAIFYILSLLEIEKTCLLTRWSGRKHKSHIQVHLRKIGRAIPRPPLKRLMRFLMAGMWLHCKWVTLTELHSMHTTLPATGSAKWVCFKCHSFSVTKPPWPTSWLKVCDCTVHMRAQVFTSQRYVDDPVRSEARGRLGQSRSLQQGCGPGDAEPLQSSDGFKLSQTLHSVATRAAVGKYMQMSVFSSNKIKTSPWSFCVQAPTKCCSSKYQKATQPLRICLIVEYRWNSGEYYSLKNNPNHLMLVLQQHQIF